MVVVRFSVFLFKKTNLVLEGADAVPTWKT